MSIVLLLFGCATTNGDGRWYNNLYKRDYETPMEKYYSRDFLICLNLVLDAPKTNQAAANSAEQQTHDCLRKGGWFWDAPA